MNATLKGLSLEQFLEEAKAIWLSTPYTQVNQEGRPIAAYKSATAEVVRNRLVHSSMTSDAVWLAIGDSTEKLFAVAGATVRSQPSTNWQLKEWFDKEAEPTKATGPTLLTRLKAVMEGIYDINRRAYKEVGVDLMVPRWEGGTMAGFADWIVTNMTVPLFLISLEGPLGIPGSPQLEIDGLFHAREKKLHELRIERQHKQDRERFRETQM